jgi:hypothetical protein
LDVGIKEGVVGLSNNKLQPKPQSPTGEPILTNPDERKSEQRNKQDMTDS